MPLTRRRFLAGAAAVAAGAQYSPADDAPGRSGEASRNLPEPVEVRDADELQKRLDQLSHQGGGVVRLARDGVLSCQVRSAAFGSETSLHALLVPDGVALDLNGGTLQLDLRSNSYGVRLGNRSAIRNGRIRVVHSAGKGSQAVWHSAVSVGAAYDDGGDVATPGRFSSVERWRIEDLIVEQPFEAACIQLMSEAHHGVIRNIQIVDSPKALLGVGLDWGTLGPVETADEKVSQMRRLWEQGRIRSTHPHHVLIENIRVGKLGRSVDGNDAAVRCSGCHHITIRNVSVESAMAAVAVFGGDFGFEFAPDEQRKQAHQGYVIENIRIDSARLFGVVLNGAEDNIHRAGRKFGYKSLRDSVHPGLDAPVLRNLALRGTQSADSRGVFVAASTGAQVENFDVEGFEVGLAVDNWVRSIMFRNGRTARNRRNLFVGGGEEAPQDVKIENVLQL